MTDLALDIHAEPDRLLRVAIIEPHLLRVGGIRRLVELANRLVDRGHDVSFYLPESASLVCEWLPCRARIAAIHGIVREKLDVVLFTSERHWYLLSLFPQATTRVFYALGYSKLYGKRGSWESLRADVDLQLANSTWTADRIEAELGRRPTVLLGGVSHEYFHPVEARKRYPILCAGDKRPWKGTQVIEEAARLLGVQLERYAGKDLPQSEMAAEYCKAEVFAVGSPIEGFGQPGLEALACGVPLVTTDNGGCREYALHEQTALVVPPENAPAMAAAIDRIRREPALADRLRRNGLELVRSKFDWDRSALELERLLVEAVDRVERGPARSEPRPALVPRAAPAGPLLSVVVPIWNELAHTQRFVEAIRQNTDVPYELIAVDNGSDWETATYVREAADVVVRNERNLGFAVGMNQGLARARGEFVAFCNNDTVMAPEWASRLVGHLRDERVGIVVPAVTNALLSRTVRAAPGETVETLDPFEAPPAAVVYVMRSATVRELGGFSEEYELASGEDTDLAFTVWVNGLDLVYDSRVLVQHRSKGTAQNLDDWASLWKRNRAVFLEKWTSAEPDVRRLERCPPSEFAYRLAVARSVAGWMKAYFTTRDKLKELRARRQSRVGSALRRAWRVAEPLVPARVTRALRRRYGSRAA